MSYLIRIGNGASYLIVLVARGYIACSRCGCLSVFQSDLSYLCLIYFESVLLVERFMIDNTLDRQLLKHR